MRNDKELLLDIKEAIENIQKYAIRGREAFEQDELIQTWIIHHLQIIGEASGKLSQNLREQHSVIPWSKIIGMRNILVHNYFGIDIEVVWAVVENELTNLLEKIETMLQSEL